MVPDIAPRFPPIPEEDWNEAQAELARIYRASWRTALAKPDVSFGGHFDATFRTPGYAAALMVVSDHIRNELTVPKDIRELAVLMVIRENRCQFEWQPHLLHAEQAGFSLDALKAIANGTKPLDLTPVQSATYDAVHDLIHNHGMSDRSFTALEAAVGQEWLIGIVALVGHYTTAAMLLNTARVTRTDPLPDGIPDLSPH